MRGLLGAAASIMVVLGTPLTVAHAATVLTAGGAHRVSRGDPYRNCALGASPGGVS